MQLGDVCEKHTCEKIDMIFDWQQIYLGPLLLTRINFDRNMDK